MSVDIISRRLAMLASTNAANSLSIAINATQRTASIDVFANLAQITIDTHVTLIQSAGLNTTGQGGGTYVSDAMATAALAASLPMVCAQSADGRYWRLAPQNGAISIEQLGAIANDATKAVGNVAAANAALTYLAQLGGGVLTSRAGTFTFDAATLGSTGLVIPTGVTLRGVRGATVWVASNQAACFLITANGAADMWIEDIEIQGRCQQANTKRGGIRRTKWTGALTSTVQYAESGIAVASAFGGSGQTYSDGSVTLDGTDFTHTWASPTITLTQPNVTLGYTAQQRNVLSDYITLDPTKRYVFYFQSGFLTDNGGNPPQILLFDANKNALAAGQGQTPANLFVPNGLGSTNYQTAYVSGASYMKFQVGCYRDYSTTVGVSAVFDLSKVAIYYLINDLANMSSGSSTVAANQGSAAFSPGNNGQILTANCTDFTITDNDFAMIDRCAVKWVGCTGARFAKNRLRAVLQGITDDTGVGNTIVENDFDVRLSSTGGALLGLRSHRLRAVGGTGSDRGEYSRNRTRGYSWSFELLPGAPTLRNVCCNNIIEAEFTGASLTHGIWEASNNVIDVASDGLYGIEFPGTATSLHNGKAVGNTIRWAEMSGYNGVGMSLNTPAKAIVQGGFIRAPMCIVNPPTGTGGEVHIDGLDCEYGYCAYMGRESALFARFGTVRPYATQCYPVNGGWGGSAVFNIDTGTTGIPVYLRAEAVSNSISGVVQTYTHVSYGTISLPRVDCSANVTDLMMRIYIPTSLPVKFSFEDLNFVNPPAAMSMAKWANIINVPITGSKFNMQNVKWDGLRTAGPGGSYAMNMLSGNPWCAGYPTYTIPSTAAGASFSFTAAVKGASLNDPPYQVVCFNAPAVLNGIVLSAMATADNTVTVTGYNLSGVTFNPGSQTYQITGGKPS